MKEHIVTKMRALLEAADKLAQAERDVRHRLTDRSLKNLFIQATRVGKYVMVEFDRRLAREYLDDRHPRFNRAIIVDISNRADTWIRLIPTNDADETPDFSHDEAPPPGTQFFKLNFISHTHQAGAWWVITELVGLGAKVSVVDDPDIWTY